MDDQDKVDCYLDDLISVIPDLNDNELRGSAAVPLAIHLSGRPISDSEFFSFFVYLISISVSIICVGVDNQEATTRRWSQFVNYNL
jgi:hypothetical protein